MFLSYEQRARKTALRVAIERDPKLPNVNRSVANSLFTSKKVLNIEFSRRSSCYLLITRLISEASRCEAPNFLKFGKPYHADELHMIKIFSILSLGLLKCIV